MTWTVDIGEITAGDRPKVGGKAYHLARLSANGFAVPRTVCLTTEAYRAYVDSAGIRERIQIELNRKPFSEMRWEEIWDAALRIRHLFTLNPLPSPLARDIVDVCNTRFGDRPLAVRSSAPDEDAAQASFAGLHESHLNVRGADQLLKAVRWVWASLWSDAALLYRQELGLAVESSAMAVVIQETVVGSSSGVVFTESPDAPGQGVVEAVFGLNEGLVDGSVAPDRWHVDRVSGRIRSHVKAEREAYVVAARNGTHVTPLPDRLKNAPILSEAEVAGVFGDAMRIERCFESPQDVEWTLDNGQFVFLQARPITTGAGGRAVDDKRGWYLSLHRSFENLVVLRRKIEGELVPEMIREASQLARTDLSGLSDARLAEEVAHRQRINDHWVRVYWEEFIPYAHGVRLFGQFYNDTVSPENPYEFLDLLAPDAMESLDRNRMLEELAAMVRGRPEVQDRLARMETEGLETELRSALEAFVGRYGDLACTLGDAPGCRREREALIRIVLEMADHPPAAPRNRRAQAEDLASGFLARFSGDGRRQAADLLSLARSSYRLRDDDNIHLGRIEAQLFAALGEQARRRGEAAAGAAPQPATSQGAGNLQPGSRPAAEGMRYAAKPRQLVGQPAGPGLARAAARVVRRSDDLLAIKAGEILVCDAVDPNMTYVVPLAAGIVERRGGMLIHGAIIAREYGIPCVTGVPGATELIRSGDRLTLDGYLGIVTVG